MACGCKKDKRFEVVAASGSVIYSTDNKPTADAVSRRYPGSSVKEKQAAK